MEIGQLKQELLGLLERETAGQLDSAVKERLGLALSQAETAGEVACCVVDELDYIYKVYGQDLTDLLKAGISPEVWQAHGVLFNPEQIPTDGLHDYVVLADGSVQTVQQADVRVEYYGNVRLDLRQGIAAVWDSNQVATASGSSLLFAHGSTEVIGHDQATLHLYDRSRGSAYDSIELVARDESFVQVMGQSPVIYADQQAQVLVREGTPKLCMDRDARAVIMRDRDAHKPMQAFIGGEGLLYIADDRDTVQITEEDFKGTVLEAAEITTSPETMRDIIVPRHQQRLPYSRPIVEPIELDKLKQAIQPFLPDSLNEHERSLLAQAVDEDGVCSCIVPYLPEMVDKGLTGSFLQNLISEWTLLEHNIHVRFDVDDWDEALGKAATRYFFGDMLVNSSHYPGTVYGFGQAVVVANEANSSVILQQAANGIVLNSREIKVLGSGLAVGVGPEAVLADTKRSVGSTKMKSSKISR